MQILTNLSILYNVSSYDYILIGSSIVVLPWEDQDEKDFFIANTNLKDGANLFIIPNSPELLYQSTVSVLSH